MKYPVFPVSWLHRIVLIVIVVVLPYTIYNYVTRDSTPTTIEGDGK